MSDIVLKSGSSALSVVKSAWLGLCDMFATIAAAGAVANAVENRRRPSDEDLALLGLERVEFKRYY